MTKTEEAYLEKGRHNRQEPHVKLTGSEEFVPGTLRTNLRNFSVLRSSLKANVNQEKYQMTERKQKEFLTF